MIPKDDLTPVDMPERIVLLDFLRGFALLGIMFVNMTWFTGYAVLTNIEKSELGTAGLDRVVYWLIQVFVDGKFWTLFALLFGVGVAVQQRRASAAGNRFRPLFLARIGALFVIGMFHAVFLWFGDIVSLYAVAGLSLLWFGRCSHKAVLRWSIVFLTLPMLQSGVRLATHTQWPPGNLADPGYGPNELLTVFANGSYWSIFHANWEFLKERWVIALHDGRFLKLIGMFLLGNWVGMQGILAKPEVHRGLLKRTAFFGILVGLPASAITYLAFAGVPLRPPSMDGWFVEVSKTVSLPSMSLAYAAIWALLFPSLQDRRIWRWFACAGRMSLTNYMLQSVVGIGLFYGCGIGAWGRIGMTYTVALIVIIFGFQVGFSRLWLHFFRFGPLEWVLRCLTYGRSLPLLTEHHKQLHASPDRA